MDAAHKLHSSNPFGWIGRIQDQLRENAIATWGDGSSGAPRNGGPDRLYRTVRAAWRSRR
jgi:hypothetical protein